MRLFKNTIGILILCLTVLVVIIAACEKKEEIIAHPKASFSINPPNGNTTTGFIFDASSTQIADENAELLFRWDWDGDNEWDTPFSKGKRIIHRFYSKGIYSPQMEARTLNGLSDTLQIDIEVIQGYSPPFAKFVFSPDSGHIITPFIFDASGSMDDEDSLSQLQFRWDWEGNGAWDTDFSNNPIITHQFLITGSYNVTLQVKDPSNLSNIKSQIIDVDATNKAIFVDFTINPESGTNEDTFTFDASASVDTEDPDNVLKYMWTCSNPVGLLFWKTDFLENPVHTHKFTRSELGDKEIILQVSDINGLKNSIKKEFTVLPGNSPPNATFIIGSQHGNIGTEFYFDASEVNDYEDYQKDLMVRWDFNNDGSWDTDYSKEKTLYHKYETAGDYEVVVDVIDTEGSNSSSQAKTIIVTNGTNETGLIIDERDIDKTDYYGTVKIGNQWWTSDNLNRGSYMQGGTSIVIDKKCYRHESSRCEEYGALYNFWNIMMGNYIEGSQGICPAGWHVPSVDDWETLFDYVGSSNTLEELEPYGPTDFFLKYAGSFDTSDNFKGLGSYATFWTSKRTGTASSNSWSYTLINTGAIESAVVSGDYGHSVRCIKN
ncbi:FISUMP domain-containing protein [Bacteroidota bacterium]